MSNSLDLNSFFSSVLSSLNVPVSAGALDFLRTWAKYERRKAGDFHGFNPLNTTKDMKSVDAKQTNYNTNKGYPVKSYSNFETGVAATAQTLKLPYYKNILSALKEGVNTQLAYQRSGIARELNTWGTRSFARNFKDAEIAVKPSSKKTTPKPKNNGIDPVKVILILIGVGLVVYFSIQNINYFI